MDFRQFSLNADIYFVPGNFLELHFSVVLGSFQVPEYQTRWQKSIRTGPGPTRKYASVLETELEMKKALGQFYNL